MDPKPQSQHDGTDAAIVAAGEAAEFGRTLNEAGIATVSPDEHGRLIHHDPNGSTRKL